MTFCDIKMFPAAVVPQCFLLVHQPAVERARLSINTQNTDRQTFFSVQSIDFIFTIHPAAQPGDPSQTPRSKISK